MFSPSCVQPAPMSIGASATCAPARSTSRPGGSGAAHRAGDHADRGEQLLGGGVTPRRPSLDRHSRAASVGSGVRALPCSAVGAGRCWSVGGSGAGVELGARELPFGQGDQVEHLPGDERRRAPLDGLRRQYPGDSLLAPKATRRLIDEFVRRSPIPQPARPQSSNCLPTARSRCCARWLAGTPTPRSPKSSSSATPRPSRVFGSLLAKLQVRDRAQLVMLAYEHGVVTPTQE